MFFAISEGLVMAMILISVRHVWGHVYSDQEEVVTYVAKMVLLIAVSSLLDGIQSILSGTHNSQKWPCMGYSIAK
jgi:MATE family multidrug resistance protein